MKKSSAEDFLLGEIFTNIRKNENLRNQNSEILLVTKTIVCQFHETRTFVFFQRP